MRKIICIVFAVMLAFGLLISPTLAKAQLSAEKSVIDVRGSVSIDAAPDIATVNFDITSKADSSREAFAKNKEKTAVIKSALQAGGINEKDINISFYSIYPESVYSDTTGDSSQKITGYSISQSVRVLGKKDTEILDVIDALTEAGVTDIYNIYLDTNELTFGVKAEGEKSKPAIAKLKEQLVAAKNALTAFGLTSKKNFIPASYSISPTYEYSGGTSGTKKEYTTTHNISVKVRDLTRLNDAIDTAMAAGADTLTSVTPALENYKTLQKEARRQAFADAKAKAEEIAQLNGVKVGKVYFISDVSLSPAIIEANYYGSSYMRSIQVSADVQVQFLIKK